MTRVGLRVKRRQMNKISLNFLDLCEIIMLTSQCIRSDRLNFIESKLKVGQHQHARQRLWASKELAQNINWWTNAHLTNLQPLLPLIAIHVLYNRSNFHKKMWKLLKKLHHTDMPIAKDEMQRKMVTSQNAIQKNGQSAIARIQFTWDWSAYLIFVCRISCDNVNPAALPLDFSASTVAPQLNVFTT